MIIPRPALVSFFTATMLASAPAQAVTEGYASNVASLPNKTGSVLAVSQGTIYFDGKVLTLDDGKTKRSLLTFTSSVFGSFTIPVGNDRVLFGESATGGIWLVHLVARVSPKKLATLKFNYDAVAYTKDWALVSAKTGGFSSKTNDIIAVNLNTGKTDAIANLPGASGPLAADDAGNLYYATASNTFPPPKGSSNVLRFEWRTVHGAFGATTLDEKSATIIHKGLDAAADIALDNDGDLLFTDYVNKQVGELSGIASGRATKSTLVSYSSAKVGASSLQFVPGTAGGGVQFEAFQPTGAGKLLVHESVFGSTSQLRTIGARRAVTSLSTKPRAGRFFYLQVRQGPALGAGFVAIGFGFGATVRERAISLAGFEATVPWQVDLLGPTLLLPIAFDGNGAANLPLVHPGVTLPLKVNSQAAFADRTGRIAASSTPLRFILD